ncbi:thrombin inhibitor hemalin-like [Musca vetustissima]|uniref:thrombin inhibitor hemalin-like n=1 Tax=Musca vetustissima TaxID=27455 RepID=UPI002AB6FACB|nr:thrombin inhibitor hemalin-like [Musca vetustissima]
MATCCSPQKYNEWSLIRPVVDICDRQPTITGLCLTSTLGIYYDAETQHCRYVGCSPDKKLFASLDDCEKICNSKRRRNRRNPTNNLVKADTKALVNTPAAKEKDPKCLLPMEPGPCRMRLERYYYNAETDSCETFIFGGCRGNANAFGFKETCEAACKSPLVSKKMKPSTLKSLTTSTVPITEKPTVATTASSTKVVTTAKAQVAIKK